MKAALFNISDIQARSFIHENVSDAKLMIAIERVQDSYLQSLLGDGLYNELQERKISGTLTTLDEDLISNYLLPCFVIRLEQYIIAEHAIDVRNLTVGTIQDGQIRPLTVDEIRFHLDRKEHELRTVEKIAIDFICNNYTTSNTVIDNQKKNKYNFDVL